MKKIFSLIIFALLLSGCTAEFDDVSHEHPEVLNTEFQTKEKLYIYGYTLKVEQHKKLDGYTIHEPPGISGPEVISKFEIPIGSKFVIYKVQKCSNCFPFTSYNRYLVKFSNGKYTEAPISFGQHIFENKDKFWQ